MSHRLIIKDAIWQLVGRVASAVLGLLVVKIISPYLGPYRFGDYKTILDFFAIWGALADFGLYVIALKTLGVMKEKIQGIKENNQELETYYGKFVFSRLVTIGVVYIVAIFVAYMIPSYTSNPFLMRGLPLGMMFSATFMTAGIVQLPLQLFWKMEQVSIALIGARLVQIVFLVMVVYLFFVKETLGQDIPVFVFLLIVFSILLSGASQAIFVWWKSQKYLRLKLVVDRGYTWGLIKDHWQYGTAYFLSSFHTLFIAILFSIFYPTIQGWDYVGIWSLALVFITVLIIIPATLGNSMIHKISHLDYEQRCDSLGHFLALVVWVGGFILIGCTGFADQIVYFLGDASFLGWGWDDPGSNTLLPWLALIMLGSFVKQSLNYNFVAHGKQNLLLWVNLLGVIIGVPFCIRLVQSFGLLGGLYGQGFLELLFLGGALYFSRKHKILPNIPWRSLIYVVVLIGLFVYLTGFLSFIPHDNFLLTVFWGGLVVVSFSLLSYKVIKKIAKGLSPV